MIRDPFYCEITDRLGGPLDPESFERCAQDLLREVYPALVPIRGGSDAGMDGAIADGEGRAYPLVCTTSEQVLRNLKRSLRRYQEEGGPRRKVVCATSQALTQRRRNNLEAAAEEQGFVLLNVHDRAAVADLLYHSPKWCSELLNLSGEPPALSIVPSTIRPMMGNALIGRDFESRWIADAEGDRLVVGQPGCGKTHLLRTIAKQKGWLFVVSHDVGRIAQAIRSQNPEALIVDDAHGSLELLDELRRLREEIRADVPIVATCWPGAKDEVSETLGVSTNRVCEIRPLTRPQMLNVLKDIGISGPDRLVYEILNQAEGRPGLAATLAYFCREGDVRAVVLGDALARSVRFTFERLVGPGAMEITAALALGGRTGMSMQAAATGFGCPEADIRRDAIGLAAGGVLYDVGLNKLSVRPEELRHVLVRDVFFSGATSLDVASFFAGVDSVDELALTLIGARGLGAEIPSELFTQVLEYSRSEKVWQSYAWLGPTESRHALNRRGESATALARPALQHVPDLAVPLLLQAAITDKRPRHAFPDQPLRLIHDWVMSALPGSGEPVRRRTALLDATRKWLETGGDQRIGLEALADALHPGFEYHRADPVLGRTVTFSRGLLTAEELRLLGPLWQSVADTLRVLRWPIGDASST
jgi:hypothetical protein